MAKTITSEEYAADPSAAVSAALEHGLLEVIGVSGEVSFVISIPRAPLPRSDDYEEGLAEGRAVAMREHLQMSERYRETANSNAMAASNAVEDYKRTAECRHGEEGALVDPTICSVCSFDRDAAARALSDFAKHISTQRDSWEHSDSLTEEESRAAVMVCELLEDDAIRMAIELICDE